MPRLVVIALLVLAAPAVAEPQVTVLLPTSEAVSAHGASDGFGDGVTAVAGTPQMPIDRIADSLYASEVAVHVLDALHGPLPVNREYVLAARQARTPLSIVFVVNVDQLFREVGEQTGAELLAMQVAEMRALLELYGIGGAGTAVYHDSSYPRRATAAMVGDRARLADDLNAMTGVTRDQESLRPARKAAAEIYLLSEGEAPGHAVRIERTISLYVWIAGEAAPAKVTVDEVLNPGDVASIQYRTDEPLPAAPGVRLMLISNGHVVGVGVVTDILER